MRTISFAAVLATTFVLLDSAGPQTQAAAQATPGFHHLHLSSADPEAAVAFYTKAFPSTSKVTWGGLPALRSPNNVLVLFAKIEQPAAAAPQTVSAASTTTVDADERSE